MFIMKVKNKTMQISAILCTLLGLCAKTKINQGKYRLICLFLRVRSCTPVSFAGSLLKNKEMLNILLGLLVGGICEKCDFHEI